MSGEGVVLLRDNFFFVEYLLHLNLLRVGIFTLLNVPGAASIRGRTRMVLVTGHQSSIEVYWFPVFE